ncbi:hypothetical protein B0H11DRAFT_780159 [Mycena galericulata]|nr:hypothetical protein B0H11DRAFT_780159 [Mycena galericulata]
MRGLVLAMWLLKVAALRQIQRGLERPGVPVAHDVESSKKLGCEVACSLLHGFPWPPRPRTPMHKNSCQRDYWRKSIERKNSRAEEPRSFPYVFDKR